MFHTLDRRMMLAVQVTLSNGLLKYVGTDDEDTAYITETYSQDVLNRTLLGIFDFKPYDEHSESTHASEAIFTFYLDQVKSISMDGRSGNDTLVIGARSYQNPITLIGGAGNDTLSSDDTTRFYSAENTKAYIDGGAGNDDLEGNGTVIGGDGNDIVHGIGWIDTGNGDDFYSPKLMFTAPASHVSLGSGNDKAVMGRLGPSFTIEEKPQSVIIDGGTGNDPDRKQRQRHADRQR